MKYLVCSAFIYIIGFLALINWNLSASYNTYKVVAGEVSWFPPSKPRLSSSKLSLPSLHQQRMRSLNHMINVKRMQIDIFFWEIIEHVWTCLVSSCLSSLCFDTSTEKPHSRILYNFIIFLSGRSKYSCQVVQLIRGAKWEHFNKTLVVLLLFCLLFIKASLIHWYGHCLILNFLSLWKTKLIHNRILINWPSIGAVMG